MRLEAATTVSGDQSLEELRPELDEGREQQSCGGNPEGDLKLADGPQPHCERIEPDLRADAYDRQDKCWR